MFNSDNLVAITSQFETKDKDMPRISTSSEKLIYTSLKRFQEAFDTNAIAIASDTTELGHLVITISHTEFIL